MKFTVTKEYIPHFVLFIELVILIIAVVIWALMR